MRRHKVLTTALVALAGCLRAPDTTALDDLTTEVETLRAEVSALQAQVADCVTTDEQATALAPYVTESEQANELSGYATLDDLDATQADLDATRDDLDAVEARYVTADTTVDVANCAALIDALEHAHELGFAPGADYTIRVAAGTWACASALVIDHPQGSHIRIVGATGDPDTVKLQFAETSGVYAQNGGVLGLLDGITLVRTGSINDEAVLAFGGATVWLGTEVKISGPWYYGVRTSFGGAVWARGVEIVGVGTHAIYSEGYVDATNVLVSGGSANSAIVASGHGTVNAEGLRVESTASTAYLTLSGGVLLAPSSFATANAAYGYAANSGFVWAPGSMSTSGMADYVAREGGIVFAPDSTPGAATDPAPNEWGTSAAVFSGVFWDPP